MIKGCCNAFTAGDSDPMKTIAIAAVVGSWIAAVICIILAIYT